MRVEHKRNYVLDAMRFLFNIIILIHHSYLITDNSRSVLLCRGGLYRL